MTNINRSSRLSGVVSRLLGVASRLLGVAMLLSTLGCVPDQNDSVGQSAEPIAAQQALAGVGKGGQKLKDHSDFDKILSGPISSLKHVEQLAPLEIQIPHAMNLYQAEHGRFPKSHDEFMTKIVEFNKIQLPELPEGAVYHYNKEAAQLWVYAADEVPQD